MFKSTLQKSLWQLRNTVLEEAAVVIDMEILKLENNRVAELHLKRCAEKIRERKVKTDEEHKAG